MNVPKQIISYLEDLVLSGGDHDGERFTVLPWERRFIQGAFGTDGDAALTVGRGNGKSALVAGLACCVVDPQGPLHGNRREVICIASSFEQGRVVFEDVLRFLAEKYHLSNQKVWKKHDSANNATLEHRPTGSRIRCLGSDPARAHGLRASYFLLDEPVQWDIHKRDRMYSAVRTSLGKTPNSKLIALGTRPADDDHWFSRLLESADYSQVHAADKDDDAFKKSIRRKANPSLSHLPSLAKRLAQEADDAKQDETLLASFKSLRLNMGTMDTLESFLLDPAEWQRLEGDAEPTGDFIMAFDLGASIAMSAACAYWPSTGAVRALACWPEKPTIQERQRTDSVEDFLYEKMVERGELIIKGGRVSDVAGLVTEAFTRWGTPVCIVADRYKQHELLQTLEAVGAPVTDVSWRGMGWRDGGEDVRLFKRGCLKGRVIPERSLLLRAAMREARTLADVAGTEKLSKKNQGGRRQLGKDDAVAAMVLGVAEGLRRVGFLEEHEPLSLSPTDSLLVGSVLAA